MRIYKVIPAPGRVVVKDESEAAEKIGSMANVIVQESVGGWELVTAMPVNVSRQKGKKYIEEPYNALVFVKDVLKEYPKKAEEE
ncbi:MAG TPA: hypothetical protein DDW54_00510 [Clostridiales bacterium]|nr:hypothetical protein [Clostridiales bacterium]